MLNPPSVEFNQCVIPVNVMVVVIVAILQHICTKHDEPVRPDVVVCGLERTVVLEGAERHPERPLLHEGGVYFLAACDPECGVAEAAFTGGEVGLGVEEDLDSADSSLVF